MYCYYVSYSNGIVNDGQRAEVQDSFYTFKGNDGIWQENNAIPVERKISLEYSVSRSTVRKAIQMMTEEGYLRSEHGSGTVALHVR